MGRQTETTGYEDTWSLGGSIGGIVTENNTLTIVGTVCTVLSAAIYTACEAYVDGKTSENNRK